MSSPRSPSSPAKRATPGPSKLSYEIPQFYFPKNSQPLSSEALENAAKTVGGICSAVGYLDDNAVLLEPDIFQKLACDFCELPTFFGYALMEKCKAWNKATADHSSDGITKGQFMKFCKDTMISVSPAERAFTLLKQEGRNYLVHDDFRLVIGELLRLHPGLEFLQDTPEFQDRYLETVTYRIFYHVNRSGSGRMTLKELQRSNLMSAMQIVDEEEDINKVLHYFSYEHFYVIYCKFWELDQDHDFLIDREDLLRYGNHALTYRIVNRIFEEIPRPFVSGVEGRMGYEDFVWFILSEEDKSTDLALHYWFRCIDLDGDNVLSKHELRFFYEEQLHRMECLSQEPVLFEDILCQVTDMIRPEQEDKITIKDLKKCSLRGNFFNILFNLNKFIAFETRDPFLIRQEREEPCLTEWDRYAKAEYIRLSMEEGEENQAAEMWDDVPGIAGEAPF